MIETVGMVRIFQRSLSHRSVRYTFYIGDGDSKTFSSITASNPYGEDITVSKIECVGHVQKRMGTRLRKLKQMSSKLSDGKSIGGKGRLTDRMIDLITTYYGNAIRQNKTCLSDMRKDVWAVYFHIRSSNEEPLHSFCPVGPNSWCKYQNQVVEGSVETFRHSNKLPVAVMDAIKPVFNDLSQPKLLQKCLGGVGSNPGEDTDVCKFIVPLRQGDTLNNRRGASPLVCLVEVEVRLPLVRGATYPRNDIILLPCLLLVTRE
ncbi:uncharacterized protein TNCV_3169441 [Trichonephila clavipes]|nr:uncharacterized protein TNCV_3169441 [Trichonephila clavipes]